MNACLITFRSVTPAQRGERVLKSVGILCHLQRTPRAMEEQGCGYCLKLSCGNVPEAAAILRQQQIPYQRVYFYRPGGKFEEMRL